MVAVGAFWEYKTENSAPQLAEVVPTTTPSPIIIDIPVKSTAPKKVSATADPDPIIDCNGKNISAKLRRSVCLASSECLVDGQWVVVSTQACVDYYAAVESRRSDEIEKNRAAIETLRKYNEGIVRSMQSSNVTSPVYSTSSPTNYYNPQPIDSGVDCYDTWEEYFADHPGYVGNVSGVGATPPCN